MRRKPRSSSVRQVLRNDKAFRDMYSENVFSVGRGFDFKNMTDYPKL